MQQKVTIKVSESTLKILKKIKEENNFSSIDDTIQYLIKKYREEKLKTVFGIDKGKITPFTRDDRIEDRNG
jgi:predicted CopG family antitoxin